MRKYQLIGRKKLFATTRLVEYPSLHILSLPNEILFEILAYLHQDLKVLLALAQTCSRFRTLVNKFYLYKDVYFTPSRFHKFLNSHLPGYNSSLGKRFGWNDCSSQINLINLVHFNKPPTEKSSDDSTIISGSYNVESVHSRLKRDAYSEFVQGLRYLLKEGFGIKSVTLSEVAPEFKFPHDSTQGSKVSGFSKLARSSRTLKHLVISSQDGWSIPFNYAHISLFFSVFNVVNELELTNFIIDKPKLCASSQPTLHIEKLTLNSCTFTSQHPDSHKHNTSPLFKSCKTLILRDILLVADLSVIDMIKANNQLSSLVLDIDSDVFYSIRSAERTFNFARFNLFFKLLCSGEGGFSKLKTLTLTNFDLLNHCSHKSAASTQQDEWVPAPTDNFETFLQYICAIRKLVIHMRRERKGRNRCIRCGYSKVETGDSLSMQHTRGEWSKALKKVCHSNEIIIYDSDGTQVFHSS